MKNPFSSFKHCASALAFLGMLVGLVGYVQADSYNLIIKQNNTPLACAVAGFEFTKGDVGGSFPATNPSVKINAGCIPDVPETTFNPGWLNVVVRNVWMNKQSQGLNVVGVSGTLRTAATGTGANRTYYSMKFTYTGPYATAARDFTITKTMGTTALGFTTTTVATGTYFARNVNSVPEPETLALLVIGLGGLAWMRSRRHVGGQC